MLDRALEYFTAEALEKTELYYSKLGSLCSSKDEEHGKELEKVIRLAEQTRWSLVKSSQQELGVNDLEFVSFNSNFNEFKRSLASSVRVTYPFTEEQLRCGSYWIDSSMITARDGNETIFPCLKFKLVLSANAVEPEKMFYEDLVMSHPCTFREQVYALKEGFDTTLDKERCARGLNIWKMFEEGTGLSKTEEDFYDNFWIRTDRLAFDTALDEERAARGLNEWKMLATDIMKKDVCTKLQEGVIASRLARGPLSAKSVSRRVSRMAEYFSNHKFLQGPINAPGAAFFTERVEIQTAADVAANFKKYRELEAALFQALVAKGAPLTETFGSQKQFKFKSQKAKTHMDERMALRATARMKARAKVQ